MASDNAVLLLDFLREHRVLPPTQLRELEGDAPLRDASPEKLVNELTHRGWLTPYQAAHLLHAKARRLLVGPYIVLDRLGGGSMGRLYKARHRDLGRLAALKVLRRDCLADAQFVARFRQEVAALARLEHPHIVRAYDALYYGKQTALVMEYVPGPDLKQWVGRHGPLAVKRACLYVRQVAAGLQHAWERGIVHRDLKPANLLLAEKGACVKITDFGLARLATEAASVLTRTGMHLGTVDFMAPEQIADARSADVRADLYSLGCTFYFLLTGQPPFAGGSEVSRLMRHAEEEPPPVENLRPQAAGEVAAVIHRLLAKAPADRYQTPAEVIDALATMRLGPEKASPVGLPQMPTSRQEEGDTVARYREPTESEFTFDTPDSVPRRPEHLTGWPQRKLWWRIGVAVGVGLMLSLGMALLVWTCF
jgi:serine/threonine protein kinase